MNDCLFINAKTLVNDWREYFWKVKSFSVSEKNKIKKDDYFFSVLYISVGFLLCLSRIKLVPNSAKLFEKTKEMKMSIAISPLSFQFLFFFLFRFDFRGCFFNLKRLKYFVSVRNTWTSKDKKKHPLSHYHCKHSSVEHNEQQWVVSKRLENNQQTKKKIVK